MTQQNSSQRDREHDLAIDRYIQALDQGDLETIVVILDQAAYDTELDRLIHEAHDALYVEAGLDLFAADAEQVLTLVQQHLPSAFVDDAEHAAEIERPLTVGEVVARLQADRQIGTTDQEASHTLQSSRITVPDEITARSISDLAHQIGVAASERFWRAFREAAIMLGLGHSQSQARLAAAREQRTRYTTQRSDAVHQAGEQREEETE
jgi:hypothetical protein